MIFNDPIPFSRREVRNFTDQQIAAAEQAAATTVPSHALGVIESVASLWERGLASRSVSYGRHAPATRADRALAAAAR